MDNIKNILGDVIKTLSEHKSSDDEKLERLWAGLIDGKEQRGTKIAGRKDDKLIVYVESPAWLYHMRIKKRDLLEKLRDQIPDIKEIIFKVGKING